MPKLKPLARLFRGIPVVEATEPLEVTVLAEDRIGATRKDASKCVFARACNRLFRGQAEFYKHVAYVELEDHTGVRHSYAHRFRLNADGTRLIMEYDRTGRFKAGSTIQLMPPPLSNNLEYLRQQKHIDKRGPNKNPRRNKKPMRFDTSVRNGTGSLSIANLKEE